MYHHFQELFICYFYTNGSCYWIFTCLSGRSKWVHWETQLAFQFVSPARQVRSVVNKGRQNLPLLKRKPVKPSRPAICMNVISKIYENSAWGEISPLVSLPSLYKHALNFIYIISLTYSHILKFTRMSFVSEKWAGYSSVFLSCMKQTPSVHPLSFADVLPLWWSWRKTLESPSGTPC